MYYMYILYNVTIFSPLIKNDSFMIFLYIISYVLLSRYVVYYLTLR